MLKVGNLWVLKPWLCLDAEKHISGIDQEIKLKVDVINTDGQVFSKDTTIEFDKGRAILEKFSINR